MKEIRQDKAAGAGSSDGGDRRVRADAQRNVDALLQSALEVFTTIGVDAPVRAIAEKAGVGIGTVYRHFPQRSDLIAAVFRREIDACADAAQAFIAENTPFEALSKWIQRYASFVATKRGMGPALHAKNAALEPLRTYFFERVRPALQTLLESAVLADEVRTDVDADDILTAVASLCMSAHDDRPDYAHRMVALFVDGLRQRTSRQEGERS